MIYTDLTKKALKLCFEAHKNQTDKSGLPYVFHPFHLAEQMTDEDTVIAALLHDVIEDTDYSVQELREAGFPEQVINALLLLTHNKNVPYMDYVLQIRKNPISRAVKTADLLHNSDIGRLDNVTPKDLKRIQKYMIALEILKDDPFDKNSGYFKKRIPLDFEHLFFLSVFYMSGEVLKYSLDVEAAEDSHYEFNTENGERIRVLLNERVSLPEALAEYLTDHNEYDFESLMADNKIAFQSFHFA